MTTHRIPLPLFVDGQLAVRRFHHAFELLQEEIASVKGKLMGVNLDVPTIVTGLLGRQSDLNAIRPAVLLALPSFDMSFFDKLESYGLALGHSHALYLAASTPSGIPALVTELTKLRGELASDATSLARRGVIPGDRLAELRGSNGYKNLAFDVFLVCALLRAHWSALGDRTGLLLAELDRAETLADGLLVALGEREARDRALSEATLTRQRAFTLFLRAYSQVRRAVMYLYWEGPEVDRLAPSLYAGRKDMKKARHKAERAKTLAEVAVNRRPATLDAGDAPTESRHDEIGADTVAQTHGRAGDVVRDVPPIPGWPPLRSVT